MTRNITKICLLSSKLHLEITTVRTRNLIRNIFLSTGVDRKIEFPTTMEDIG